MHSSNSHTKEIDSNQAVFTVRDILRKGELIKYVVHDHDNEWQFLPGYKVAANTMMIVAFHQIIDYDNSINSILNLGIGQAAYRRNIDDEWLIMDIEQ